MNISIVTPTLDALPYLKLCCASVADQTEVVAEHIVIDGGSTDGTVEWLKTQPSIRWISEKDRGMYSAINKGLRMARGEIVAHLNSDEQYLPHALDRVVRYFNENEADIVFGDTIVIDTECRYVCSRKSLKPTCYHTWICHLSTFTASTFFRYRLLERRHAYFNESWKSSGDLIWMLDMLRNNVRMALLKCYTSTFTDREDSLALSAQALKDRQRRLADAPVWAKCLLPAWKTLHRVRRLAGGVYRVKPFRYAIYTPSSSEERVEFNVTQPTFFWKSRHKPSQRFESCP